MSIDNNSNETPEKHSTQKRQAGKRKRRRGKSHKKIIIIAIIVGAAVVIGAAAAILWLLFGTQRKAEEVPEVEIQEVKPEETVQEEEREEVLGSGVLQHLLTAGNAVWDSFGKRPKEYELTESEAASFAEISECVIDRETKQVSVTIQGDGVPKSDDKFYYLIALNTYDTGIPEDAEPIAKDYKNYETKLSAGIHYNQSNSRLYKKFVAAVKKDGKYLQVSGAKYITNPEVLAKYSSVYQHPASKKGLLIDPFRLYGNEMEDLGLKQAAYNIFVERLLGPTSNATYPTIHYTYNGRTYAFNGQVIAEYDFVFKNLTKRGITTTAILLNGRNTAYTQLLHPNARSGITAPYCMFNGAEESGVEYIAAVASFLADRYSGDTYGRISNWIIANEINARKEWNYIAYTDVDSYVEEYVKGFRVFYTAIKSISSSARVYMPLDQQWDRNLKNNPDYDGRDVLDVFNRKIAEKGNIDWGLAQHPYNVPLTSALTWKGSKYIEHNAGTSMISMANIEVLVNYMRQSQFLNDKGEVRSILLSEQGYTSTAGEANQAAAFAYAYYKAEAYPEIDGFLLNRQTDAPEEVAQGLAFGLTNSGGGHKQVYNVFKYIDTPEHAQYTDFAKGIIGISNWNEIIR